MNKKEKIRHLKKNNRSFAKGAFVIKLAAVLGLCFIAANQGALYVLSGTIYQEAVLHLAVQSVTVLLVATGKVVFPLIYAMAMLASLGIGLWLYVESQSMFYLVQCLFFFTSFLLMMFVLINKHAKCYRKELKNLKKPLSESSQEILEKQPEVPNDSIQEPAVETQPVKKTVEMDCPIHLDLSYGSFSRFLILHYPFVYLHPKFDVNKGIVQMCISAEGFDQQGNDMYSGKFVIVKEETEQKLRLKFEAEDELSYLCALICADWLISQKGTLVENGINVSADLMKKLTEAFVQAQDAKKHPFEGFQNL